MAQVGRLNGRRRPSRRTAPSRSTTALSHASPSAPPRKPPCLRQRRGEIAATGIAQTIRLAVVEGLDPADQDDVIARVDDLFGGAVEPGRDIGEHRRAMRALAASRRRRNDPRPGARRCSRRPSGLRTGYSRRSRAPGQGREVARGACQADQQQRRIERHRGEGIGGEADRAAPSASCAVTTVTPVRKAPNASRRARGIELRSCFYLRFRAASPRGSR